MEPTEGLFEDSRKWLPENAAYYEKFLWWHAEARKKEHFHLKFFECCIDRTNLENLIIWSPHGKRPIHECYRKDIVVESWTITVLTLLDDSYPLVYSITKDTSDGLKFVGFWCDTAANYLFIKFFYFLFQIG